MSHVLCLGCARPYRPGEGEELRCPHCGFVTDPDLYEKIEARATDAVRYGWQYRRVYSDQAPEDTTRYYLPEPSQLLIWAAIAAASGVIGNASWALVRSIVARLVEWASSETELSDQDIETLRQQSERDLLFHYLDDYFGRRTPYPPHVRAAVIEEMLVHEATDMAKEKGLPESYPETIEGMIQLAIERLPQTPEEMKEVFEEAARRIRDRPDLSEDDFAECWKNVDLSG